MKTRFPFLILLTLLTHLCLWLGSAQAIEINKDWAPSNWSFSKTDMINFFVNWRDRTALDPHLSEVERDQRVSFLDRLVFQIDRKYSDQDLRLFFIQVIWDMALTDELSSNQVWGQQSQFLKNLSLSLKDVLEPSENILGFILSYVEFSSLHQPRSIDEFAESRSYTNGQEFQSAETVNADQAAESALQESPEVFNAEALPERNLLQFQQDLRDEFNLDLKPEPASELPFKAEYTPDKMRLLGLPEKTLSSLPTR